MKGKKVGFTAGKTNRMKAKLVFVVAGTPFLLASSAVHAVNGGHTVTVTDRGRTYTIPSAKGTYIWERFTAQLSSGTHDLPNDAECGKPIDWDWTLPIVTYVDEAGEPHFDLSKANIAATQGGKEPSVQVELPTKNAVHRGYKWKAGVEVHASQGPTTCHPEGWTQGGAAVLPFDDSASAPPPANPPADPPPPPADPPPPGTIRVTGIAS